MTSADFAPIVAAYLSGNHSPPAEMVLRRFSLPFPEEDHWKLLAVFFAAPDAARLLEANDGGGYRYVRLGIETLPGRQFKITFIQPWHRGKTEGDTVLCEEVFDVH